MGGPLAEIKDRDTPYVCLSQRLEPTQAQALRSKKTRSSAEPVLRVLAHPWLRLNNQTWGSRGRGAGGGGCGNHVRKNLSWLSSCSSQLWVIFVPRRHLAISGGILVATLGWAREAVVYSMQNSPPLQRMTQPKLSTLLELKS